MVVSLGTWMVEPRSGAGIGIACGGGMQTNERTSILAGRIAALVMLGAVSLGAGACAPVEDDTGPSPAEREEPTAQRSDALRNTGGSDPDECTAALHGCYSSCAKSGSASCYRYCDIVYARCRGLPEPSVGLAGRTLSSAQFVSEPR